MKYPNHGIILLSDLHLSLEKPVARLDDTPAVQFRKIRHILDFAREHSAPIVQAGDFFDKPRSWFLLPQVTGLLKEYDDVPIYSIFGQHDTYLYSAETRETTNHGVLEKSGLVTILGNDPILVSEPLPISDVSPVYAYGASYGSDVPEVKVEHQTAYNMLVIHAPISTEWVGGDFLDAEGFLGAYPDYDLILCGDIHRQFIISHQNQKRTRHILNTGPLVRREATKYNFTHRPGFFYLTTEGKHKDIKWIDIPFAEDAEQILSREHIEEAERKQQIEKEMEEAVKTFISKLPIKNKDGNGRFKGVSFQKVLQDIIKEHGIETEVVDIVSEVMSNEPANR